MIMSNSCISSFLLSPFGLILTLGLALLFSVNEINPKVFRSFHEQINAVEQHLSNTLPLCLLFICAGFHGTLQGCLPVLDLAGSWHGNSFEVGYEDIFGREPHRPSQNHPTTKGPRRNMQRKILSVNATRQLLSLAVLLFLSGKIASFLSRFARAGSEFFCCPMDVGQTGDGIIVAEEDSGVNSKSSAPARVNSKKKLQVSALQLSFNAVSSFTKILFSVWDTNIRNSQAYGVFRRLAIVLVIYLEPDAVLNICLASQLVDAVIVQYSMSRFICPMLADIPFLGGSGASWVNDFLDCGIFSLHFAKVLQLGIVLTKKAFGVSEENPQQFNPSSEYPFTDEELVRNFLLSEQKYERPRSLAVASAILCALWALQLYQTFYAQVFSEDEGLITRLAKAVVKNT